MSLRLYNTLHRNKEEFEPLQKGKVRMYVCGVTVYDRSHIGHARANVVFDVIYRYLKFSGYEVTFIRNFTDVDDKIIKRSNELKITWQSLTQKYIEEFTRDITALGNIRPTMEPKATDHITEMLALIDKLVKSGKAYVSGGDVFYKVRSFPNYGDLSKKKIEELEAGARVEVQEAKSDPLDFVLWKAAKPGEPSWDSPWGPGRPGWHIECSAMSMKYLGESFDIHGGGRDLIFPHHENEIAQSEGATGKPFVKYWLHNGFVNINADKMSKSLGNIFAVEDVLKLYDWEALRAFLVSVHYRSPIDFSDQSLQETREALERFYSTVKRVQEYLAGPAKRQPLPLDVPLGLAEKIQELFVVFKDAMDDDFNTAMVIGSLFEAVRAINKLLDMAGEDRPDWLEPLGRRFLESCEKIHTVLGCYGTNAEGFFKRQQAKASAEAGLDEATILKKIDERNQARIAKDFKKADEIRNELLKLGIVLKDRPDGTTEWSVK
jgi:cysteinyl-tRNA synthetase